MQGFHLRLHWSQRQQLKKIERTDPSPRVRFRARLLLAAGKARSLLEVARQFECSWRTVQAAINRYRQGGVKALADAPRAGRPRQVPPKVRKALVQALEMTPRAAGLGGFVWTVERVRRYLRRQHHIDVSPKTAWREIGRCRKRKKRGKGYVWSPDPLYEKKKGIWSGLDKQPERRGPSPCGMKMRVRSTCCL